MEEIVSTFVKPSGGLVLPAIPSQPTAKAGADTAAQPRSWSFISNVDGKLVSTSCPAWCDADHENDRETPTHPRDIWHQTYSDSVFLPVSTGRTVEDVRVLSWTLNVRPFDTNLNLRLPHASVEIMEDEWVEELDPDAFEAVIDTLEERVKAMRQAHAQLVRARAAYKAGR